MGGRKLIKLNEIGKMVDYWWQEIENHFNSVIDDEFIVMPNYVHGIIKIQNVGADRCVGPKLGKIVQWFKTMSTNEYIKGIKNFNWPRFDRRFWERNYYERIIRNESKLNRK